jgi:transposase
MAAITEIFLWDYARWKKREVWPRRTRLCRTKGIIKEPVSSAKTKKAFMRQAFFNPVLLIFDQSLNVLLISFHSPYLWFLWAQSYRTQQTCNMLWVVSNAET